MQTDLMQTEANIKRVRNLIGYGMTYEEIVDQCLDLASDAVYLAYHAALILLKDDSKNV